MSLESISWLSDKTGFDRRTVKNRLKSIPPIKDGRALKFETTEVLDILYCGSIKETDTELIDGMEPLDYERWRKTKAEATAQEMKNQVTRRELAPVKLLEFSIAKFAEQASSILESIPLKVKKRLPRLKASEVELVKREIVKVQNAASRIQIDWDQLEDIS